MHIVRKEYDSWDGTTKELLRRATLPDGAMWKIVRAIPEIPTYVAFEGNTFLGWAIAWKLEQETIVQLYVKQRHRRKGVALKLIRRIMRERGKVTLCRWTHVTNMFFYHLSLKHPEHIRVVTWGRHEDEYLALLPKRKNGVAKPTAA
ncbi:MAG: hypothetical protein A3C93_05590 [Candidatus Lloydbacteria bacterium RIFCSPHIGHO2_02_FULL_54_17]|uniref:N-acetyltransferase domain-containing protein n=1 Tax=Candidatus Lloydbacteria bacterium RIFCSPHIGHO2_02_FULL_54_17 TaxID=1798664 RepID=A0A1G2DD00_9BACT|nr:MAG: hypothetical protein A3C93_05590 [Candidatus Lloydbacteria bacterium RIFCSPHIGHO2_02_FULL_54_17]OGZ13061.1 MAG: hypothetical protein A2948_03570 [Candidatus Lloydbacteria bacterium RIFCSPLOWO2_01_FULL_54_18]OGZ16509.1 MAG: hypothetical protein A3H76_04430 [Candidatus Lloydbacteria bacterium RIFCSPLOWO2_02_FULL_54_12]